jgi:hypothetical protein
MAPAVINKRVCRLFFGRVFRKCFCFLWQVIVRCEYCNQLQDQLSRIQQCAREFLKLNQRERSNGNREQSVQGAADGVKKIVLRLSKGLLHR